MTEKEYRIQYGTLKYQEMFEKNEEKRKNISKQLTILESKHHQQEISGMLDNYDYDQDTDVVLIPKFLEGEQNDKHKRR